MKAFRTLRGFIEGKEPDEETYFAYTATLRIFGDIPDLNVISTRFGIQPTEKYRIGEKHGPRSPARRQDMWSYTAQIDEVEPLEKHIDTLWSHFKPHKEYLLELKQIFDVSIFLGYRSNCDHAGIQIPCESLEMFTELEIPFGVSIIIT